MTSTDTSGTSTTTTRTVAIGDAVAPSLTIGHVASGRGIWLDERLACVSGSRKEKARVTFARDGALVSAGDDGTVRSWNVDTGQCLQVLPYPGPVWTVAVSADGAFILAGGTAPDRRSQT